jgi:hypothetical protein
MIKNYTNDYKFSTLFQPCSSTHLQLGSAT